MARTSDLLNELLGQFATDVKGALSFEKIDVLYTLAASVYLFYILLLAWRGAHFLNLEFMYRSR